MTVLGPVFWHDLVRISRRQRVTLWRVVYAGLLLAAILLLYVEQLPQADLFVGSVIKKPEQMASFANSFSLHSWRCSLRPLSFPRRLLAANAITEERKQEHAVVPVHYAPDQSRDRRRQTAHSARASRDARADRTAGARADAILRRDRSESCAGQFPGGRADRAQSWMRRLGLRHPARRNRKMALGGRINC